MGGATDLCEIFVKIVWFSLSMEKGDYVDNTTVVIYLCDHDLS